MKEFLNNPKLKNPWFWIGLISIIFASAGIRFEDLTSWKLLVEAVLSILNNPVATIAVITGVLSAWNDNSIKGLDGLKHNGEVDK